MIKNFTKGISFLILISMLMLGCKMDPPVYPEGTVANPTAGGGSVENGNTVTYTIDGKTTTLKTAFFQVFSPSQFPPSGTTQIMGGTDVSTAFSLTANTVVAGTFTDIIISVGMSFGDGTVTFTEINTTGGGLKGTVKGTFTGKVTDFTTAVEKDVSGTFNIKM
jgi:hypothetical protein